MIITWEFQPPTTSSNLQSFTYYADFTPFWFRPQKIRITQWVEKHWGNPEMFYAG